MTQSIEQMKRNTKNNLPALLIATLATLAGGVCLFAGEARADFMVTLGGAEQAVTDPGFDFLSEDSFLSDSHLHLSVGVIEGVRVGVEWDWAREEFEPYNDVESILSTDALLLTSRYGVSFADFFEPYAVIGAGFNHAELRMIVGGAIREQSTFLFQGHAAAGFELHVPPRFVRKFFGIARGSYAEGLTAGIYFEGGYRLTTDAEFNDLALPEPEDKVDPEDAPLATGGLGVGSVNFSGVMARSGLLVRF